jgi:hypothetical protein
VGQAFLGRGRIRAELAWVSRARRALGSGHRLRARSAPGARARQDRDVELLLHMREAEGKGSKSSREGNLRTTSQAARSRGGARRSRPASRAVSAPLRHVVETHEVAEVVHLPRWAVAFVAITPDGGPGHSVRQMSCPMVQWIEVASSGSRKRTRGPRPRHCRPRCPRWRPGLMRMSPRRLDRVAERLLDLPSAPPRA